MDHHEGPSVADALERLGSSGASAAQIADTVALAWHHAEQALAPVIGAQGVAALYRRSLLVTARSHAGLAALTDIAGGAVDAAALAAALAQYDSRIAARVGGDFLQTFYNLVGSLIGASLIQRLLHVMLQALRQQAPTNTP